MKQIYFALVLSLLACISAVAQTDIHKVDFMNFTYQPSCTDMENGKSLEMITVKKGEFSRETKMEDYTDHFYFNILAVEFGDLNGDKQDEAVVLSVCNTGGTGQFSEGFVYTIKAGKPTLLARVPGGDRADGGLRSLKVESGLLVIDANDESQNAGACCPEGAVTSKVRLLGDKLIEVGKPVSRLLYPAQRLAFDKGASGKTFTFKIAADDRKRYTVGARVGQTLTVLINNPDGTLRLLGDTETTDGTNSFTAKLPKTGDYTFEVANYNEKEIEVSVTITIK